MAATEAGGGLMVGMVSWGHGERMDGWSFYELVTFKWEGVHGQINSSNISLPWLLLRASAGGTALPAAWKTGDLGRGIKATLDKSICLKVPPGKSWKGGVAVQCPKHLGEAGFCLDGCDGKHLELLVLSWKKCCRFLSLCIPSGIDPCVGVHRH